MIKLVGLIMIIALTGCANILTPQIKSSVTANHQFSDTNTDNSISAPDAVNRATTYKFAPTDAQLKSPEYLQYEFILRQHLLQNGFAAVKNNQSPDVLVTFSYHMDEGTEKQRTRPHYDSYFDDHYSRLGYSYGGYGSYGRHGRSGYSYSVLSPHFFPRHHVDEDTTVTYTEYEREFSLVITPHPSNGAEQTPVYSGTVTSKGTESDLAKVMPAMIAALFKNFPGESGKTHTVSLPVKQP